MRKINILIVDDTVLIRRMLSDALTNEPSFAIQATAENGKVALAKIAEQVPDCVILDVEMPEMNGLQTLIEIRKQHPRLPVIMFSTLTGPGAAITIEALMEGASDCVPKPQMVGGPAGAKAYILQELGSRIKAMCTPSQSIPTPVPLPAPPAAQGPAWIHGDEEQQRRVA